MNAGSGAARWAANNLLVGKVKWKTGGLMVQEGPQREKTAGWEVVRWHRGSVLGIGSRGQGGERMYLCVCVSVFF